MSGESGLKLKYQTALAVHLAMTGSLVVYTLLIEIFSGQLKSVLAMDQSSAFLNMRYLFYGIAILVVLAIRWSRQMFLRNAPPTEPEAAGKLLTMTILTAALCEIPVLLGVILFILIGYKADFYFLLIISIFLFFMYFPRILRWQEWWQSEQRKKI